ncbi:hypothetical protein F4678DRAFT_110937 [Xylaria arbuscula]|nr:hypothetical protein F4678DRAFT_110937 [Xylaria arbuscula]
MAPSYPRTSYIDDRRSSGAYRDSYRSGPDRPPPARRDSRDGRYANESREIRSPHESRAPREYPPREHRRDNEPPRPHADSNFRSPEGPKRMSNHSPSGLPDRPPESSNRMSNNSPAGLPDKPFRRINTDKNIATKNSVDGSPMTSAMPKASNPKLQAAFENAYNWGEKCNKRLLLSIRRSKIAQETTQRQTESEKFVQKAPSFPPYVGLGDNFSQIDRAFDDECKVAEDEYIRGLEQLVACFATVPEPAATNRQDPVIAALEAKVDQISQTVAKRDEQIQNLLEENKKYSALKSDLDELQLKFRTFEDTISSLQSRQVIMDTENRSLKQQVEDLQSNGEKDSKDSKASRVHLAEFIKQSSDTSAARELFEMRTDERVRDIETKLAQFTDYNDIKEKLEDLDVNTLNDVSEAWVDNIKSQYNDYKERRHPDDLSIYEIFQSLRQRVDSLQASQTNVPPSNNETVLSMNTIEAAIKTNIEIFEQNLNKAIAGRDNLISDLLDDTAARISSLEEKDSGHSELSNRIQLLEQWSVRCSPWIDPIQGPTLAERVANLEGRGLGHRIDRIDLDVGGLSRKFEALASDVAQLAKPEWVEHRLQQWLASAGMNSSLVKDVKDHQRRIPTMELAIKTLDTQFQNLTTKQVAECIMRLLNPVFEQRLGKVEAKANQLEAKANLSDQTVNEQLTVLNTYMKSMKTGEKRTASPNNLEESNKRRRLEVNGRHPTTLQQQQAASDRHPSS